MYFRLENADGICTSACPRKASEVHLSGIEACCSDCWDTLFPRRKELLSYLSLILKPLGRTWRVFEISWAPQAFPWCPGVATVSKQGSERPARWIPGSFYAKWLARPAFTEVPHSSWGSQMQGDCL